MTRRKGMLLAFSVTVAVVLNIVLFSSAALLSRDRPVRDVAPDPVSVNLITLKPATPPPPDKKREIPKPKPKPKMDFTPELARPSLRGPAPLDVHVQIDPSLFTGGPERGEFIFNSGDLDQAPRKVVQTSPVYPYKARQRNIEGFVKVKMLVRADGTVGEVTILDAQPKGLFDDAALKACPNWRFQPGVIDGVAVPSWVVTTIRFTLNDLSRSRSSCGSLRPPWLRDPHDAPAPRQHTNLISSLAPFAVLMSMMVLTSLEGSAQTNGELREEQAAIESGENLSARAKKTLFRSRGRQDEGDFTGAARIMSEFMDGQVDREHPLLLFNLALSHFAIEQDEQAYVDLSKAVNLEPRYGRAWLRLGEAAYNLEKYAEAGEAFRRAYDLTPERTPEILYYAGVSLLTGKRAGQALESLEKLLEEHREAADMDWYQALISAGIEAGKAGRVVPFVENLLADRSSEPRAWELAYRFAAAREDYEAAALYMTITGYLRPLTRSEAVQLGDLYAVISVPLQAARFYDQAMAMPAAADEMEKGRAADYERLASAWLGAHDHAQARATLKTALGEKETVGLWSLLGDLEYLDDDFDAALTAFGQACRLDPEFGRGWLMMGYCALELGREGEARGHLDKAATFPGQATSARSLLGRIGS